MQKSQFYSQKCDAHLKFAPNTLLFLRRNHDVRHYWFPVSSTLSFTINVGAGKHLSNSEIIILIISLFQTVDYRDIIHRYISINYRKA